MFVMYTWGGHHMTENEKELLNIIRTHDNPEQALEIATRIILSFVEPHESSQEQSAACQQALA